jgi:DNA-binding response OmpR family regulator
LKIILVIGERPEQATALAQRLGVSGLETIPCARDWKLAVRCLTSHNISLIVAGVDRSPESAEFFMTMRELTDVPIVAFGAGNDANSIVWHLEHGAADYIPAASPANVLAARLALRLKDGEPAQDRQVVRIRDLTIDTAARTVTRGNRVISLTPLEFRLLAVLTDNLGRSCSRQMLLERVWGKDFQDCTHYLRLYVGYLRQKIEVDPGRPRYLLTEWGYGYRLVEPTRTAERTPAVRQPQLRTASTPG